MFENVIDCKVSEKNLIDLMLPMYTLHNNESAGCINKP